MNSYDVMALLRQVEATPGRNDKEMILLMQKNDPFLREILTFACSPYVTFGIKPPRVKSDEGTRHFDLDNRAVMGTLRCLADRTITGNEASDTVRDLMFKLHPDSCELLWRILNKDLRCGITSKTINKVISGLIPIFDVMLAHPFEEKRIKTWPVAVEPKMDGVRVIGLQEGEKAQFFSRTGKPFPGVDWLAPELVTVAQATARAIGALLDDDRRKNPYTKLLGGDLANPRLAFDGEIVTGAFNATVGAVRRKGEDAEGAEYHVFDVLPFRHFTADECAEIKISYKARRAFTEFVIQSAGPASPLRLLPRYFAGSVEEVQEWFTRFREMSVASFLARGDEEIEKRLAAGMIDKETGKPRTMEGVIVKPFEGTYQKKRSHHWLKIKTEETEDLRVVGWFEGRAGTKLEGGFGGFIVDRINPADGQVVKIRIGGGFSDAQRAEFLELVKQDEEELERNGATLADPSYDRDPRALHRLIEVEFHEVTPDGSLRHPRFLRWRDDKDPLLKDAA